MLRPLSQNQYSATFIDIAHAHLKVQLSVTVRSKIGVPWFFFLSEKKTAFPNYNAI